MCKHIYCPENNYTEGTPFTYLISWSHLDIHYYGVRYSKDCHPKDIWNNYFTSSIPVENFRELNGEPDIIKVNFIFDSGDEARAYEEHFLRENNCVKDFKWLNLCNGGKDYCCTGHTEETKQKMSESHTGKSSGMLGKHHSEETCNRISESNKGKIKSEETLTKLRKPKKCKDNYFELKKGFIWINDGVTNKMIDPATFSEYPGWEQKMFLSDDTLQKRKDYIKNDIWINNGIVNKRIKPELIQEYLNEGWQLHKIKGQPGLPHTDETKLKLSEYFKGSKWMNDGNVSRQIKPEHIQEHLNLNWTFGRLKYHK